MLEDLKLLKKDEHELRIILAKIQTGQLFLKEAIEDYERKPSPRFGN